MAVVGRWALQGHNGWPSHSPTTSPPLVSQGLSLPSPPLPHPLPFLAHPGLTLPGLGEAPPHLPGSAHSAQEGRSPLLSSGLLLQPPGRISSCSCCCLLPRSWPADTALARAGSSLKCPASAVFSKTNCLCGTDGDRVSTKC